MGDYLEECPAKPEAIAVIGVSTNGRFSILKESGFKFSDNKDPPGYEIGKSEYGELMLTKSSEIFYMIKRASRETAKRFMKKSEK